MSQQKMEAAPRERSQIVDQQFWKDRQAEFERCAERYPDLEVHWNAVSERWWFSEADGKEPFEDSVLGFKTAASEAAARLPGISRNGELWESWILAMRLCCADAKRRHWCFQPTSLHRCNLPEWDSMQGGKTLAKLRIEQGRHPFGIRPAEDEEVYERSESGELQRVSEEKLEHKTSDDLSKYFHYFESGFFAHIFRFSANFCEELALQTACSELEGVSPGPAIASDANTSIATIEQQQAPANEAPDLAPPEGLQPQPDGEPAGVSTVHGGFPADMDRHNAISQIIGRRFPNWRVSTGWRKLQTLERVCDDLDAALSNSTLYEMPRGWKSGTPEALKGVKATGWRDALNLGTKKLVADQIANSLRMVRKNEANVSVFASKS